VNTREREFIVFELVLKRNLKKKKKKKRKRQEAAWTSSIRQKQISEELKLEK
jgi:hypothetical protein